MVSIDWSRLEGATFEDMVACLLSHQNADIQRIDGAGGDGGRDCEFDGPDGLHAFEMKGFPRGRIGKAQRRQVERSLKRAVLLKPADWVLITPVDPNPTEKAWFDKLRETAPFPIAWRGRTWLDMEFARHTFIADYYLGTTRDEVVDLLMQMAKEEAALAGGLPDALRRAGAIVQRANGLDPHYRFEIATDGTKSSVTIIPAYKGAELDRPISFQAQFRFDTTTDEGRAKLEAFHRALDFGTPVELSGAYVSEVVVDAPAGLGGTYAEPTISMGPGRPATTDPITFVFSVMDPAGSVVADLPIRATAESSGRRGTILRGADRHGYVQADIEIDVESGGYHIKFRTHWDTFLPQDFLPVARFLASYHAPNTVSLARDDGTMSGTPEACPIQPLLPVEIATFVADLALIQLSTGISRDVTADIGLGDLVGAAIGRVLLTGGAVRRPWATLRMALAPDVTEEVLGHLARDVVEFEAVEDAPVSISICGTEYPIGSRHQVRVLGRVDPSCVPALESVPFDSSAAVSLLPDSEHPLAVVRLAG